MALNDVLTVANATSGNTYVSKHTSLGERAHDVFWTLEIGNTLQGVATVEVTGDDLDSIIAGTARWVPYTSFQPTGTLSMNAATKTRDYIDFPEASGGFCRVSFEATAGSGPLTVSVKAKRH